MKNREPVRFLDEHSNYFRHRFMKSTYVFPEVKQIIFTIIAIFLAILVGVSFLVTPEPYAPLFIIFAFIAIIALVLCLLKPEYALYFSLFVILLPLGIIPAQIHSYLNRGATVLAFAVWLVNTIVKRRKFHITSSSVWMLVFILWAIVTLLWVEKYDAGFEEVQTYVLRLILFLIVAVNIITTIPALDGLMYTLALSGMVLVGVSGYSVLSQGYMAGSRLQVFGMNENQLGISLIITIPGVIWWAQTPKKMDRIKKILAIMYFVASITLIGLSGSRGSAISLGIMLLFFLVWKPSRPWGILGLLIVGVAVLVAPIIFSTTITRFLGQTGESALGGRENIWPAAWEMIKDHLVQGVGIGNAPYQIGDYIRNLGLEMYTFGSEPLHNPVLTIMAETGIIGLLMYGVVLASAVLSFAIEFFRSRKEKSQYLLLYFALISSVFVGYLPSWIKGGSMESEFSYFLMLALLLIPSCLAEKHLPKEAAL